MDAMSQMAVAYRFGHMEQMEMPGIVWRHYYALIRRRDAERSLAAAQASMVPHMKSEDQRTVLDRWRQTATAPLRSLAQQAGDSWHSIRSWWRQVLGDANRE